MTVPSVFHFRIVSNFSLVDDGGNVIHEVFDNWAWHDELNAEGWFPAGFQYKFYTLFMLRGFLWFHCNGKTLLTTRGRKQCYLQKKVIYQIFQSQGLFNA